MQIWKSPHWPNFKHDPVRTEQALAGVVARLGLIEGMHAGLLPDERQEIFLRAVTGEALASFGIEGVPLARSEIEASVVASLAHRQTVPQRRSDAVAALMLEARAGQGPLTHEVLFHWHRLLFHGIEVEDKGRYRSFPIEIVRGATGRREDVLYVAPPHDTVPQEMDRFLDWLATDQTPIPIRAAIAHLWFESIHPFSDGNGRIGRAIIEHVFAGQGALPFSLSRQIEADKRGYYAALQAGRTLGADCIDATPFVLWLLEKLDLGIAEAGDEARFLVRRNAFFVRMNDINPRAAAVMRRLFAKGQERVEQGISAGPYTKIAKVSSATATRDLNDLEKAGLIRKGASGGRSTYYEIDW